MSIPTIIVCLVFIAVVIAAMVVAWLHMQALNRYTSSQSEMKKTVVQLNAAILTATVTLKSFQTIRDEALAQETPASIKPAETRRPARPMDLAHNRRGLATLLDAIGKQ